MPNRGKLVIVLMLLVGVVAATLAWWYHATSNRRILEFWTPSVARRIAQAPHVEAWELAVGGQTGQPPQTAPLRKRDVSTARGVSNIRYALVQDSTFDWESPAGKTRGAWKYALRFDDGQRASVLLFDADARRVTADVDSRWLTLDPRSSREIKAFFDEQLRDQNVSPQRTQRVGNES